jgi:hypothetical protein
MGGFLGFGMVEGDNLRAERLEGVGILILVLLLGTEV